MGRNGPLERIGRDDRNASLKFAALVAVLLVLPGEELDVLFGLNPRRLWSVVVFVAGLSFLGYLLSKVVDPSTAIGATGAIGGCISPGLTITSLMEQARRYPAFSRVYAFAAAIAVTMLFPRNLVVVGIVRPSLAVSVAIPFVAMAGVSVVVTGLVWSRVRTREPPTSDLDTPFKVRSAFVFVVVLAAIMTVVNTLELSMPDDAGRIGVVLITVVEMVAYVAVTWTAGAKRMAGVLAVILASSASVGIALVALT